MVGMNDLEAHFSQLLAEAGLQAWAGLDIRADGRIHRFRLADDKPGRRDGWYVLRNGAAPAGHAGDWKSGRRFDWLALEINGRPVEKGAYDVAQQRFVNEQQAQYARVAAKARALWDKLPAAPADHAYLVRKQVAPGPARINSAGRLVLPVYDSTTDELSGLQFIAGDGTKRFMSGSRTKGGYLRLGYLTGADHIVICEGFATGSTIAAATGLPVVVAFNCGNLLVVGSAVRRRHTNARITIAADDDQATPGNPGVSKGLEASLEIGGVVVTPPRPGDFNDLSIAYGAEAVRLAIAAPINAEAKAALEAMFGPLTESDEATILRLSRLSLVEYDRLRTAEAKKLGVKASTLDAEVRKRRQAAAGVAAKDTKTTKKAPDPVVNVELPTPEPWPAEVDGALLLNEIISVIKRHIRLGDSEALATALWIIHAHALEASWISPRLYITGPTKRCGKSRLLFCIKMMVPRALETENLTPAVLFRVVHAVQPTLLIDEIDSLFGGGRDAAGRTEVRGLLNAGFTRGGTVLRTVGDDYTVTAFRVFGATVLSGISGALPDTVVDRSIVIALERKLPSETVERLEYDRVSHLTDCGRRAARWAADNVTKLETLRPDPPDALHDRQRDCWRPLLAIAEQCGEAWLQAARNAAAALSGAANAEAATSDLAPLLLHDCKEITDMVRRVSRSDGITSADLLARLIAIPERPWGSYGRSNKPITLHRISKWLRRFGIHPTHLDAGSRGYRWKAFDDASARY